MAVKRAANLARSDGAGVTKLWAAFIAAPLAWLIDLEASYATVDWACAHDRRAVLFLFPLACLAIIAVAAWVSRSIWDDLGRDTSLDGASVKDRTRFLAVIALMMCATFALVIITTFAARSLLSPCE
jgi:hypothetical protein